MIFSIIIIIIIIHKDCKLQVCVCIWFCVKEDGQSQISLANMSELMEMSCRMCYLYLLTFEMRTYLLWCHFAWHTWKLNNNTIAASCCNAMQFPKLHHSVCSVNISCEIAEWIAHNIQENFKLTLLLLREYLVFFWRL